MPNRPVRLGLTVLLTVFVAPLLAPVANATPPAPRREPSCSVSMDNPHYSSGNGGVIAKARFTCTTGASQAYYSVGVGEWGPCDRALPSDRSAWNTGTYGCDNAIEVGYTAFTVGSGKTETRYVPKTGTRGPAKVVGKYYRSYVYYRYSNSGTQFVKVSGSVKM